jgi:hypothetical protein
MIERYTAEMLDEGDLEPAGRAWSERIDTLG